MQSFLLKGGPVILFLVGLGFDVSDFFGSTTLAYAIWAVAAFWAAYLLWAKIRRRNQSEAERPERTGIRQRGGSGRYRNARIRNQDVGMDTRDADIDAEDLDIE